MRQNNESGQVLVAVLLLVTLGLLLSAGMLDLTATGTKTRAIVKTQAKNQYECEETLNKVVAWLQTNSKNIVGAFVGTNFTNNFDLSSPTEGANEGAFFGIPTMVKMKGTNNSVMLSNNDFFGQAAFPATQNIETNASFDAVNAFANADLGNANARAILMWARHTDGNYEPVFRVDAVTGNNPDRGAHLFTYVYTQLNVQNPGGTVPGIGFYTEDTALETKTGNNQCYSYKWVHNGVSWSKGAPRSNCIVASKQGIILESKINGSALTNVLDGVTIDPPSGQVSGTICEAPGCHSHSLSAFADWTTTCGAYSRGNLTVNGNTNLGSGPTLNDQCWDTVTISNNSTLTLSDKSNPYRFKNLVFQNNSNSRLALVPMVLNERVTLYVDRIGGDKINGNQAFNLNNSPSNFQLNLTSTYPLDLQGTADIYGHIVAPLANITLTGNFMFHGKIEASGMYATGNARFNYDENFDVAAGPTVSDMAMTLKKASQRYR